MSHDYAAIYSGDFFEQADGIGEWRAGKLKLGDALAAIGYAVGLRSFQAVQAALNFDGPGRGFVDDGETAAMQLLKIVDQPERTPRGVLEIGAGRGEVSAAFAYLDIPIQTIEPSPGAVEWLSRTMVRFFDLVWTGPPKLFNMPAHEAIDQVNWAQVDTVVMVESLEHILAEDFEPVYERIRDELRKNRGRFIITNWIDYHPIHVGWYASADVHCRLVDDALYDKWSADAARVVFRQGSHLVLDY